MTMVDLHLSNAAELDSMSLSFGMNSPRDCLEDFRQKVQRFDADDLNASLAMDCAIAGWTVLDWVFRSEGKRLGYSTLTDLQDSVRNQCPEMGYLQDISNARKHKDITRYRPRVQNTRTHRGGFSHDFSRDFDRSRLVFDDEKGEVDFFSTLQISLSFLESFFSKHKIS